MTIYFLQKRWDDVSPRCCAIIFQRYQADERALCEEIFNIAFGSRSNARIKAREGTKTTISSAAHQLCNRWARFRRTLSLSHRKAIFHLGRSHMSRESNKIGPELELEIWKSFGNLRGCDWSAFGYARCWYDWLTFENVVVFLWPAVDAEWVNQTLSFSQLMPTIGQLEPFVTPSWIYNFSINEQL